MPSLPKIPTILFVLALVGLARWPVESGMTESFRDRGVLQKPLDVDMRDQLSQNAYVAAFGGFRSLIASLTALQADVSWQNKEWGDVERKYEVVTALQPQVESYWEAASWHMAYNAASYYLEDWNEHGVVDELRREYWRRYIERGHQFLEDGIRKNPESWKLRMLAGMLFSSRFMILDHAKASEYFEAAFETGGAPEYLRRRAVYELSYVPEKKQEAMRQLKELYDESPRHHTPVLLGTLLDLQLEFKAPASELVPIRLFGESAGGAAKELGDYKLYRESLGGSVSLALDALIVRLVNAAKKQQPPTTE